MVALFVVCTILLFIIIDAGYRFLKDKKEVSVKAGNNVPIVPVYLPARTPEGIFFTISHTWINLLPSGNILLGTDDFVGGLLEKPEVRFLKMVGDRVRKGEPMLVLKENTRQLTIKSPIAGEILIANENLKNDPELLKTKLFSDGWAYGMKPKRQADLKDFLLGQEARTWMSEEYKRLRDFLARCRTDNGVAPAFLQDGGLPVPGSLRDINYEDCRNFEQTFLEVINTERNTDE